MGTRKNNHLHSKTGFTLIELLMALAISSIVLGAIYSVFKITNRSFTTQNVAAGVQQSLRSAIGLMSRDIRLAGLDPSGTDNFGITYASATKIRFTQDSKDSVTNVFNGIVDEAKFEEVTYDLQGDQIMQTLDETVATPPAIPDAAALISSITNLNFDYFDAANHDLIDHGLTPPRVPNDKLAEIRSIRIAITIQETAGRDEAVSRTLIRKVKCRNLAFD
jgi:prepilin-type N-terminal cleavage/methylation domain-containing protein